MARESNLVRRGAVYYALITVPTDLQLAMAGQKQKWVSLRTTDYAEAKRRKSAIIDQWVATFDDMRRRRHLTANDIKSAVWEHYSAGLEAGDKERAGRPTPADIEAATDKAVAEAFRKGVHNAGYIAGINAMTEVELLVDKVTRGAWRNAARLRRLRSDLASGDTRLIEPNVDAFIAKNHFQIDRISDQYRDLCSKLMRADIEQLERHVERDRGDFTGKPADPIVTEPAHDLDLADGAAGTIMGLFAKYEKEKSPNIRPETFSQSRRDVQHFADFVGPRVGAAKISKTHIREWKDLLAEYPVKATETNIFKGLPLREIIAVNKGLEHPKPTLSRHIRRYMASLSGLCRWLVSNEYRLDNPVTGLSPERTGPATDRLSFTNEQIKTLFASPLFTSCLGERWCDVIKPGNISVRDHRYWIPLVMAYSGARPSEVAQLQVADIIQSDGLWIMHITDQGGGGKRTKTKSSKRFVPIHSHLIDLGFVKHYKAMAARGENKVFPEVVIPKKGQIAAQFSRESNRYLEKVGVKFGREIVTYSLRHTFIDRARTAGILDPEIAMVVGHDVGDEKAGMTGGYGNVQQGTMRRRAEIVEAVSYRQN